ncbi:hypothetical protein Gorai_007318 [Gossypium raimondii]|uniref:RNase H type-1 domain-containing protein n=1 Tax=Gossypium raimondii TaxID=29730 RepID=A0A7J8Q7G3_GOSRA|nr:hypothetical protein [Gossypium raimondii]
MLLWSQREELARLVSLEFLFGVSRRTKCICWGVARDMNGEWLFGFNRYLGKCLIFDAELWSIFEGIKLVQRRGHDTVIILSDSLDLVQAIQGSISSTLNSALIR